MNAYHELLDINNDGIVSIEDMRELTKRFSEVNNMTEEQSSKFSKIIEVRQILIQSTLNSTTVKKYIEKSITRFKNRFICLFTELMVQTLGVYWPIWLCYGGDVLELYSVCKAKWLSQKWSNPTFALLIQGKYFILYD